MLLKRVSIKNKNGINALFRTKKPIVSSTFRWDFEKGLRNVGYNLADKKLTNFPTKTVTALYTQKAKRKWSRRMIQFEWIIMIQNLHTKCL